MNELIKIAIYGDSQGNHNPFEISDIAWYDFLDRTKFQVTNYAEPGSSTMFSYLNFDKTYHKFDKIIFLISDDSRLLLPEHSPIIQRITLTKTRHAFINFDKVIDYSLNKSVIDAVRQYYEFLFDPEQAKAVQRCLINDMKSRCIDGLFLNFMHWERKENKFYNKSGYEKDKRVCHLSQTNNYNLFRYINDWLHNKCKDLDSYYSDPKEPAETYYENFE